MRVSTPIVELVDPTDETIPELIELAKVGIHSVDYIPFFMTWSLLESPELDFPKLRVAQTGSWLDAQHQGQGIFTGGSADRRHPSVN